jgi:hypothetical protein
MPRLAADDCAQCRPWQQRDMRGISPRVIRTKLSGCCCFAGCRARRQSDSGLPKSEHTAYNNFVITIGASRK